MGGTRKALPSGNILAAALDGWSAKTIAPGRSPGSRPGTLAVASEGCREEAADGFMNAWQQAVPEVCVAGPFPSGRFPSAPRCAQQALPAAEGVADSGRLQPSVRSVQSTPHETHKLISKTANARRRAAMGWKVFGFMAVPELEGNFHVRTGPLNTAWRICVASCTGGWPANHQRRFGREEALDERLSAESRSCRPRGSTPSRSSRRECRRAGPARRSVRRLRRTPATPARRLFASRCLPSRRQAPRRGH